ncbi:hypothetical protein ACVW00_001063 [Marmoricola sp. URHA0025 HA25]
MSDQAPPPPPPPPPPAPTSAAPPPPPQAYGGATPVGTHVGAVRSTGTCILLEIVTLGFYGLYWYYQTHEDMKRHSGRGLGGVVALILAFFVGFVMPFITSSEVGNLQEAAGRQKTVSGVSGLWILLPLVGAIVWFVKTNGALNEYWRSRGAVG